MTNNKKFLSYGMLIVIVLSAVLTAGYFYEGVSADDDIVEIGSWDELSKYITTDGSKPIKLVGDAVQSFYGSYPNPLEIKNNPGSHRTIVIDLNGHMINRGCENWNAEKDEKLFIVQNGVTLIIKDSTEEQLGGMTRNWSATGSDKSGFGGAIYNEGEVIIEGGTYRANQAQINGGAIYNAEGATLTIKGGMFSLNYAEKNGGAIYNAGTVNIEGGSFSSNSAGENGGAIYNLGILKISNASIFTNQAQYHGGAIYNVVGGKVIIANTTLTYNMSKFGGAIYNESSILWQDDEGVQHYAFEIQNSDLNMNHAYGVNKDGVYEDGGDAGAIYNKGYMSISDSAVYKNEAEHVGGAISNQGTMLISGSTISENKAALNGGAICVVDQEAKIIISGSTLSQNSAQKGGAIFNDTGATLEGSFVDKGISIIGSTLQENTSTDYGGAVFNNGIMMVSDSKVLSNSTDSSGGAVYAHNGSLILSGVIFMENTSRDEISGGGAIALRNGTIDATGLVMMNNSAASKNGGAMVLMGGHLNLNDSSFTGNTALWYGGGIFVESAADFNIKGVIRGYNNDALIGKNIYLKNDAKIGIADAVNQYSIIDFAMENIYKPFTDGYNNTLCGLTVFSYNEADGYPFKVAMANDHPELYCDVDLWNYNLGARLVYTWDDLEDILEDDDYADVNIEIALANDIRADGGDGNINIQRNAVIDLNGFTLDRGLTDDHGGSVLVLEDERTVTIKDGVGTGRITGGYAEKDGGGIYIDEGSKLIFEGGIIIGNKAGDQGGGIFVNKGELEMTGGAIIRNSALGDCGGGIYCDDEGRMNLYGVLIAFNEADNYGGAIYTMSESDATISNCRIIYNSNYDDDGGAIYVHAKDKMLYLIDDIISYNRAAEDGGAIAIDEGGIKITGNKTEICYNYAKERGGAIYTDERKVVIQDKAKISYNSADEKGGAFYTEGIIELYGGVEVSYNRSVDGGAAYIYDGSTFDIHSGATLSYNSASNSGGAVFNNDNGNIRIYGGSLTYNSAGQYGGAVYMHNDSDDIVIEGDVIVRYNSALDGNGIYLSKDHYIEITGPLSDKAYIVVSCQRETDIITTGYSVHNPNKDPSMYFVSSDGLLVALSYEGEVILTSDRSQVGQQEEFIAWNEQIADYYDLSDKNWMAGISGDRRLNEINLPGTHDSGMKDTQCHFEYSVGDATHMAQMAKTQHLYIDEQLNAGVRLFDLRLNNQHFVPYDGWNVFRYALGALWGAVTFDDGQPYDLVDDGENLWLCHGKDKIGGTFYAKYHDDDTSLTEVLSWVMNFLVLHPTETVVLGFSAEINSDDTENKEITLNRIFDTLNNIYDVINPSTGKPFIYREGDAPLGTALTEYPYLKDCRGQIILYDLDKIGGLVSDKVGEVTEKYSQDVGYNCSIDEKRQSLLRFFNEYVDTTEIPKDVTSHLNLKFSIGMNVGPTAAGYYVKKFFESFVTDDIGPLHNARVLNEEFLADGKPFDQRGNYVGWVKTDGATDKEFAYIWRSNFPEDLNYVTVNVESGLGEHHNKSYKLLLGTEITIPGCIYKDHGDLVFEGWKVGDKFYAAGTKFVLYEDVTFVASWYGTNTYTVTFVNDDDSVLEVFHYVEGTAAQAIADLAPSPTKDPDAHYTYSFAGWDIPITDAVADVTYKATYNTTVKKYTVTWRSFDGVNILETDSEVDYGTAPSYNGAAQTRPETEQHRYVFIGWSKKVDSDDGKPVGELPKVTGDVVYYASFKTEIKTYKVTFLNWDGSTYQEGTYAAMTEPKDFVPVNNPTKPFDGNHYFIFDHWSPDVTALTQDATYEAIFEFTWEQCYTVKFLDWDATVLSVKVYTEGTSYSDLEIPQNPTRSPTVQFSYTFNSWSPEISGSGAVTEDTFFTAIYDYIVNQYTIKFVNWDGTVLSEQLYDFGTSPDDIVRPVDPTKEPDEHNVYTFVGWSPEISKVTTNMTYTAEYESSDRTYTITWVNYDGEPLEIDDDLHFGDIPKYYGTTPTRPDSDRQTFTFQDWSPGIRFVSGDATYTAGFFGIGRVFNITYDPNGGYFTQQDHQGHEHYQHGYQMMLYNYDGAGNRVARDHYIFAGWYVSLESTDPVTTIAKEDFGDKTYYAKWTPKAYTITCDLGYSAIQETFEYNIESETSTLFQPERTGYTFIGWSENDGQPVMEVVITQGSTGNRTFTAQWEPNVYNIEYYDGETKLQGISPCTFVYGMEDALGPQPNKENFVKCGWYTTSDFQVDTYIETVPQDLAKDLKVYAKYDASGTTYWSTYPAAVDNLIYTGNPQNLITLGVAVGGTAYYKVDSGSYSESMPTATDAGEYRVEYKISNQDMDYDIGWFFVTIGKAEPTITKYPVSVQSHLEYDGNDHPLMASDGEATGGEFRYSLDGEAFSLNWNGVSAKDAGDYTIYYKLFGDDNHSDYEIGSLTAKIYKASPETYVPPAGKNLNYTAEEHVLITEGNAGSAIILYSLDQQNWSEESPKAADAGLYTIYYKVVEDKNHTGTDPAYVQTTIHKADSSWLVSPIANNTFYTGSPQILVLASFPVGGVSEYRLAPTDDFSTAIPAARDVGHYTVYYKIAGDSNHNDNAVSWIPVTISKGQIKPTVTMADWVYGNAPSLPVLTDNPSDGAVTYEYKKVSDDDSAYTGVVPTVIGNYNVRATIAETNDYLSGKAVGTFNITKRPLNLAVSLEDWIYGQGPNAPVVTGNDGSGGVTIQYKVKDASDIGYVTPVPSNPGSYTVKVTVAETTNYQGGTAKVDFNILKVPITLTVAISGWTYGDEAHKPTVTGNVGPEEVSIMYKAKEAPESAYITDVPVNPGTYTVKASVAESEFYSGDAVTADFSIDKKSISPTVSIAGWNYVDSPNSPSVSGNTADADVTFLYKVSGAPDSTYTTDVPVNAGSYTIEAIVSETEFYYGGSATADFTIQLGKALITVDSYSKVYGTEDPQFTATLSGLKEGDPESVVTFTLSRQYGEDAGVYAIEVSAQSTDNYEVVVSPGTLTITQREAVVSADDVFKYILDSDPDLTYRVYGLIAGDTLDGIVLTREPGEAVGLYTISFAQESSNVNYDVAYVDGMFFIISEPDPQRHEDGSLTYTSDDHYTVDENTTISIKIVETDDKDGNEMYREYSQSLEVKDIDERGNDRVTTTSVKTQEIAVEGGGTRYIDTDETKVEAIGIDAEGKDILTTTTTSVITDSYAGQVTVTDKCTVEDHRMVTEAVLVEGEDNATVTTAVLDKDAADTIHLNDVKNVERQMAIGLDNISEASGVDKSMVVLSGERPYMTVDNNAFGQMAESDITFSVTGDCGTISYSPEVAAVFSGYDRPVLVQLESGTYDDLNASQKDAIPENSLVLSVTATSGQTEIKALGGDFTMTFPFDAPEGWDSCNVFYLDKAGVLHRERTEFRDGMISVTMNHHSDVVVLQTYKIRLYQEGEGEVTATPMAPKAGETVVLKAEPAEGYVFDGWETEPMITITDNTFEMPASDVSVLVKFKRTSPAPGPTVESIEVFTAPTKTSYKAGESFDPAGLVIIVKYTDGTSANVAYAGNEFAFSFEPSLIKTLKGSDSKVKVIYGGAACDIGISVKSDNVFADNLLWILIAAFAILAIAAALIIRRRKS